MYVSVHLKIGLYFYGNFGILSFFLNFHITVLQIKGVTCMIQGYIFSIFLHRNICGDSSLELSY